MAPILNHDHDIVIVRRVGVNVHAGADAPVGAAMHVYAVTYAGHNDVGSECETLCAAEYEARDLAKQRGASVWYQAEAGVNAITLVATYRGPSGHEYSGEICAMCDTLIVEGDVVYRPAGGGRRPNNEGLVLSFATLCPGCATKHDQSN